MTDISSEISLLSKLISEPSTSRNEDKTAQVIYDYLSERKVKVKRLFNNVWALAQPYDASKPTLLLNSHHDTVKPATSYTRNPYSPDLEGDKLYGLGSNDAGASVVSLIRAFLDNKDLDLPYNLMLAITAEEEVGGEKGIRALLTHLNDSNIRIDAAIVGEPTGMQPAIAERGLIVLDCKTRGMTGHAARNEGINAIYSAIDDIERLRSMKFEKKSEILGDITLNITQISAGWAHNAIPDECLWVVDVRTTDAYTNEETAELLAKRLIWTESKPRSTRVQASVIETSHPLVQTITNLGCTPFVSPTTSDMSLMHNIKSVKIGPGDSSRSHRADEYVLTSEIAHAIEKYNEILKNLQL